MLLIASVSDLLKHSISSLIQTTINVVVNCFSESIIPTLLEDVTIYEYFNISLAAVKSTGLNSLKSKPCVARNYAVFLGFS